MTIPVPGVTKNPRYHADDIAELFGNGGTVKILYETADADANLVKVIFPEGGSVDVPGWVIGDASIDNTDDGWFNARTEPFYAVVNDAGDAYVSLDAGDDAVAGSKGLYFKAAADEDIELINLSVTGTPRIYWDESEDQFRSTKGWVFDAACDVQGTWVATAAWTLPAFTLGGTVTGGNQNLTQAGKIGLNNTAIDANRVISIQGDAITVAGGTTFYGIVLLPDLQVTSAEQTASTYGIYAGFNIAAANTQNWTGSPSIVGVFSTLGLNDAATITSARSFDAYISGDAGTITTAYGLYVRNGTGVGFTITNQYGIFIEDMTKGGTLDIGVAIAGADTACLWISSAVDTTDAPNGIFFGASRDTNLYRSAANILTTDDTFGAAGYKVGAAAGVSFGPAGVSSITVVNGIITSIS